MKLFRDLQLVWRRNLAVIQLGRDRGVFEIELVVVVQEFLILSHGDKGFPAVGQELGLAHGELIGSDHHFGRERVVANAALVALPLSLYEIETGIIPGLLTGGQVDNAAGSAAREPQCQKAESDCFAGERHTLGQRVIQNKDL